MNLLRAYVQEELAHAVQNPREELVSVEGELARLNADSDRLLANLTEANREFIDEKLLEMKRRRRGAGTPSDKQPTGPSTWRPPGRTPWPV